MKKYQKYGKLSESMKRALHGLNHPVRRRIMTLLLQKDKEWIHVKEILFTLNDIKRRIVHEQLKILFDAHLVDYQNDKKMKREYIITDLGRNVINSLFLAIDPIACLELGKTRKVIKRMSPRYKDHFYGYLRKNWNLSDNVIKDYMERGERKWWNQY